ncbi:MAG: penicillin-binding protein 2 [bacterium]
MKDPFYIQTDTPKNLYIRKKNQCDEIAVDFYNSKNSKDGEQSDEFLGKFINAKNLKLLLLCLFLGLGILTFRAYYLQARKGDYYNSMSKGNSIRKFSLPASRGIIFDRNGKILVRNVPRFSVFMTIADLPAKVNEQEAVLKKLSELIETDINEIKNIIAKQRESLAIYKPISIKDNLSYEQALVLEIAIKDLAGINIEVSQRREYLGDENFSPIMGYVGKINEEEYKEKKDQGYFLDDMAGKAGIEYFYENNLRGVNGFKEVEVNALGKRKNVISIQEAAPGDNLYLTIDKELQDQASSIVKEVLKKQKKSKASVVILNPQNGEILTLLSLPTYDNNLFAQGISSDDYNKLVNDPDKPMFFRAIAGEYPSGSVIKPVWSAAALQDGVITENTTILSTGGINIGQWTFADWKAGGHGITNVKKALADSVNSFYYYICGGYGNFKGLGIDKMVYYADLFDLGKTTGIDLPGEKSGFFPSPEWKKDYKNEDWYIGDTYHVAIGQGDFLTTPLQVARWTAFFANGGKTVKPHLVNKIAQQDKIIEINPEIARENFIDQKNVQIVKDGMRQGVVKGSSIALSHLPVDVSGKTGTAQWNVNKENHAWWTGFFPYDNPQVVITVLVEEGSEGSAISAPIAKEIIKWWCKKNGGQ